MRVALVEPRGAFLAATAPLLGEHDIEVVADRPDLALAGDWTVVPALAATGAPRAAVLREDLALREPGAGPAAARIDATGLPAVVTARWLADLDADAVHVTPGIDAPVPAQPCDDGGPLRIAATAPVPPAVLAQLAEPHEVVATVADADVLLDLSRHERLPGAALEGMRHGAVAVATLAPGREEVVRHGENGLVVAWDDDRGTARALDLLARDRGLLAELRAGADLTALAWPSHADAAAALAAALRAVAERDVPPPDGLEPVALAPPPPRAATDHGRPRLRRLEQRLRSGR